MKSNDVSALSLIDAAAGAPAVAAAGPADLVRGERIVAVAVGRGEARRDDDGVVQRAREEGRCRRGCEVVIGVSVRAVHHDQRAHDAIVARR